MRKKRVAWVQRTKATATELIGFGSADQTRQAVV
jgi:hypothetical protein